ncbi:phosphatidate cytidylyltransferase [Tenacibaculum sp. MAR_2009_124]|uniref:phosphatidate cytidylyltransferase n=1 Tax=Tenacibaculum sp. MAR_2009_124 TaxID=1250059 RepID=UPI00089726F5|nr:phosphatidate cytidylyltransferase [Tenacibaculum sp. MAR_2009_124]SEC87302.1 phosphatidate cytidylyltransferase [Tenacibaculum sp. MAR_2009_124]
MQNLVTRSISALVYAALFISATVYSLESYTVLIALFSAVCLWEFNKIVNNKSFVPFIILPLVIFYQKSFISDKIIIFLLAVTLLCSIRLIINLYSKDVKYPQNNFDKFDSSLRYIIFPFIFLMQLPIINGTYNPYLVIYIILLIWTNDSFAYLIGKNFGKTKLFESVSPKKTIEGFIGGFAFAIIVACVISNYSSLFSLIDWILIAIIVSVFGTFGDLVESKFKRQAKVKDSGTIMPGHGGLLDRLDSLFFLSPFVYLYIHYIM